MGRPQQTFWAIATFPHFAHRYPAMISVPSMVIVTARDASDSF